MCVRACVCMDSIIHWINVFMYDSCFAVLVEYLKLVFTFERFGFNVPNSHLKN